MKHEENEITNDVIFAQLQEIQEKLCFLEATSTGIVGIKQAAKILGVTVQNLYQLTSNKEIPFHKPRNKKVYFDMDELRVWIKQRTSINTNDSIAEPADQSLLDQLRMKKGLV